MKDLDVIGSLKYLYFDEIAVTQSVNAPSYLIRSTAKMLQENGGRNWVPIIVKVIGDSAYEVVGNTLAYAVAEQAGLERVWCIVADDAESTTLLSRALSGEAVPLLNLSTASKEEIRLALEYLIEQPGSPLKRVQIAVAASRIFEAPRNTWKNLNPIADLKCGITRGKKLDYLKALFYLAPSEAVPEPVVAKVIDSKEPEPVKPPDIDLQGKTVKELREIAKTRNLKNYSSLKKSELLQLLMT